MTPLVWVKASFTGRCSYYRGQAMYVLSALILFDQDMKRKFGESLSKELPINGVLRWDLVRLSMAATNKFKQVRIHAGDRTNPHSYLDSL